MIYKLCQKCTPYLFSIVIADMHFLCIYRVLYNIHLRRQIAILDHITELFNLIGSFR